MLSLCCEPKANLQNSDLILTQIDGLLSIVLYGLFSELVLSSS